MNDIILRFSTALDVDAAVAIAVEQWRGIYDEYRKILGDEIYSLAFNGRLELKAENVRLGVLDTERCIIAECDGEVCGFCTFVINENGVGTIKSNAVSSKRRGRGIAGMMYGRVMEIMRAKGCRAVAVQTGLDDAHAPARKAYEKAGFEVGLPSIVYYKKL